MNYRHIFRNFRKQLFFPTLQNSRISLKKSNSAKFQTFKKFKINLNAPEIHIKWIQIFQKFKEIFGDFPRRIFTRKRTQSNSRVTNAHNSSIFITKKLRELFCHFVSFLSFIPFNKLSSNKIWWFPRCSTHRAPRVYFSKIFFIIQHVDLFPVPLGPQICVTYFC